MLAEERYDLRRFTADEVMRMVESGVLAEDERVELIEGELIVVTPQGPAHSSLTVVLRSRFERAYGARYHVRDHSPVVGTADSIPEPDLAVVRGDPREYLQRLPGPADVELVVEIAQSTLGADRRKAGVYARAGYGCYWLIDVAARRVEVRTGPTQDGVFTRTDVLSADATVTPPGTTTALPVAELLP